MGTEMALRLANELNAPDGRMRAVAAPHAAAELRRLHDENTKLRAAIEAEREACAMVADSYADNIGPVEYDCGGSIAAEIRARGQA